MSSVPFSLLLRLLLSIWCYSRLSFSRFLNLFSLLFFSLDIFCWSPSKSMDPFSAFSNRLSSPPVKFSFSHYILFCCRVRIWFFVISVSALKIYLLIYGCHTLIVKTWFLYFFKHIIRVVWKFWLLNPTWVATSRTQLSDYTFTFHFHALEREMATHSSVLGWRIPGMGEPGGLPSMGSHRVRHNWSDLAAAEFLLPTFLWVWITISCFFLHLIAFLVDILEDTLWPIWIMWPLESTCSDYFAFVSLFI